MVQEHFITNPPPPPFKTAAKLLLHRKTFTCYAANRFFKSFKKKIWFPKQITCWNYIGTHLCNFYICWSGGYLKGAEFLELCYKLLMWHVGRSWHHPMLKWRQEDHCPSLPWAATGVGVTWPPIKYGLSK